jgi:hypothetical protein
MIYWLPLHHNASAIIKGGSAMPIAALMGLGAIVTTCPPYLIKKDNPSDKIKILAINTILSFISFLNNRV